MIGHQTWAPIVFKLLVSRKLRFSQFVKVLYPCVCLVTGYCTLVKDTYLVPISIFGVCT